jgi:hypothetical protein
MILYLENKKYISNDNTNNPFVICCHLYIIKSFNNHGIDHYDLKLSSLTIRLILYLMFLYLKIASEPAASFS